MSSPSEVEICFVTSKIANVFDKSSPSTLEVNTLICSLVTLMPKLFNFLLRSNSKSSIKISDRLIIFF